MGALRDGGLSRHADDCEIDIMGDDLDLFQEAGMRRALGRNGYELSFDPRGRCFKVWPAGSERAVPGAQDDAQLLDQSWWLPQQFVGTPSLDVYVVETPRGPGSTSDCHYVSNAVFHCNDRLTYGLLPLPPTSKLVRLCGPQHIYKKYRIYESIKYITYKDTNY